VLDPDDLSPLDRPRALAARARAVLAEVRDPRDPAFDEAYDLLASFFADRGELEPREALRAFVGAPAVPSFAGVESTYHLLTARVDGALVGVRDCYVDLDARTGRCLVSLAHVYVAPAHRRTGIAGLLRAAPVSLGRRASLRRFGAVVPTLVVAEMEPADPADPDTVIRLLAYGRSGFGVLDPARVPYSQPELRELPDARHTALPLLGVVRTLGVPPGPVPPDLAALFPELFHVTHELYLPRARVAPSRDHALRAIRSSSAPIAVLPLPTSRAELEVLAPLVRSAVLARYPPSLRGPDPALGDAAAELAAIRGLALG
jgi:hypothetical protein